MNFKLILIVFAALLILLVFILYINKDKEELFGVKEEGMSVLVTEVKDELGLDEDLPVAITEISDALSSDKILSSESSEEISHIDSFTLPVSGSVSPANIFHTIPLEEIRRGCSRQNCIPSVDDPEFVSVEEAGKILDDDSVGIGLIIEGVKRFYPFDMLVTREIVNDNINNNPVLVTYCPLCGTGIVFERKVNGVEQEFGVSGMLWQSNLLMYNRAEDIEDRNLWSQVLGKAVVGRSAGDKLKIIESNVVKYGDWSREYPDTMVLDTGRVGDPYGGDYYRVASNFEPNFDESLSPIGPSTYVHGIEVAGEFKAYQDSDLLSGDIEDSIGGLDITISRSNIGEVVIVDVEGNELPIVTGFWFSWIAAHPSSDLWDNK